MKAWPLALAAFVPILNLGAQPAEGSDSAIQNAYPIDGTASPDRVSFKIGREFRGTTYTIGIQHFERLCADADGCKVRLGMFNWDKTARVASRETLLYYNAVNRAWRGSAGDAFGTDYDGTSTPVLNAFACYLTDGAFEDFKDLGDESSGFGLVSWNQYEADCFLTLID